MQVEQIALVEEKAKKEFEALNKALKENAQLKHEQIYCDLRRLYGHMRHNKKVIDVYGAFKNAGLNDDGDPKLAVVRADSKKVFLRKSQDGSVVYFNDRGGKTFDWHFWRYHGVSKDDVRFPTGTFKWPRNQHGNLQYDDRQTIVPLIPATILLDTVKHNLRNYHIIWEVEEWQPLPPKDPILCKRLTKNMFGVLATWNLTELERAVIKANIGEE